jgi:hypothetical protein
MREGSRDVQHEGAAIDVADVGAVRPLGEHVGVVGAKAHVELLRQPRRRRRLVAFARAGIPPAPCLHRLRRVRDVEDAVELVVERVARGEVRRAGRHVDGPAVDEPQRVHAARMRPGAVELRDELRLFGPAHVEQVHARGREPHRAGLVRHRQEIAHQVQRIGPHPRVRQFGLHDQPRRARIGHVDAGEVLGRRLVRQPQDAPAVAGELQSHALADAAVALQLVAARAASC